MSAALNVAASAIPQPGRRNNERPPLIASTRLSLSRVVPENLQVARGRDPDSILREQRDYDLRAIGRRADNLRAQGCRTFVGGRSL